MTDEELFKAYVEHRRSMYPAWWMWACLIPMLGMGIIYLLITFYIVVKR